jgi:protein tyrosine/serine phosphatase
MDQWQFYQLTDNEISRGTLMAQINNVIAFQSKPKGTEQNCNQILNNVWLGNYESACDEIFLKEHNIGCVINMTDNLPNKFDFMEYHQYSLKDDTACTENIMPILSDSTSILNQYINKNINVLVHCKRGHHRSASVILYYLVYYQNYSLPDALSYIKNFRPTAFRRWTCILQNFIDHYSNGLIPF